MADKGWIKLHRKLCDNPIWTAEKFSRGQAWVDLLLNANHADGYFIVRGNRVDIKRGQLGWSEVTMAARWKWSRTKVRNFLKMLEKEQQIRQQKTTITTITTILNYELYQKEEQQKRQQSGQQKNSRRTAEEQQKNINKKNKNDKNDKKKIIGDFTQNPKLITAINDFMEMRTKIKKPMTDRAVELLLGKLSTMADTDEEKIALLEQSTANSWLSVYPLKQTNRKGGQVIGNKRRISRQDDRDWEGLLGID